MTLVLQFILHWMFTSETLEIFVRCWSSSIRRIFHFTRDSSQSYACLKQVKNECGWWWKIGAFWYYYHSFGSVEFNEKYAYFWLGLLCLTGENLDLFVHYSHWVRDLLHEWFDFEMMLWFVERRTQCGGNMHISFISLRY